MIYTCIYALNAYSIHIKGHIHIHMQYAYSTLCLSVYDQFSYTIYVCMYISVCLYTYVYIGICILHVIILLLLLSSQLLFTAIYWACLQFCLNCSQLQKTFCFCSIKFYLLSFCLDYMINFILFFLFLLPLLLNSFSVGLFYSLSVFQLLI